MGKCLASDQKCSIKTKNYEKINVHARGQNPQGKYMVYVVEISV